MPYVCVRASEIDDSDLLRFLCSPCTRKRGFLERKGRRPCHRVSREMRRTCIACAPILIYGLRRPCGLHGSDVQNNIQVAENPLGFVKEVPRPVPIFFHDISYRCLHPASAVPTVCVTRSSLPLELLGRYLLHAPRVQYFSFVPRVLLFALPFNTGVGI